MDKPSVDIVVDIRAEANKLLEQYGSRKNISHNSAELIQQYGQVVYSHIIKTVRAIRQKEVRQESQLRRNQSKQSPNTNKPVYYNEYKKSERYTFIATGTSSSQNRQIVKDRKGHFFLVADSSAKYEAGAKVRCTVKGPSPYPEDKGLILLTEPRRITVESITVRVPKRPEFRFSEVQDLGKHRCGKPFKCSCCGRNFPAYAGWRVELKELYFCNACASQIYMPKERGNHHFYITTPMGNKR